MNRPNPEELPVVVPAPKNYLRFRFFWNIAIPDAHTIAHRISAPYRGAVAVSGVLGVATATLSCVSTGQEGRVAEPSRLKNKIPDEIQEGIKNKLVVPK